MCLNEPTDGEMQIFRGMAKLKARWPIDVQTEGFASSLWTEWQHRWAL